MRIKLGKYQDGEKHRFEATYIRKGSYIDRTTGKQKMTVLLGGITDEYDRECADHAWIPVKCVEKYQFKQGKRYTFMARVGTYKRGRTASDFQLRDICQVAAA